MSRSAIRTVENWRLLAYSFPQQPCTHFFLRAIEEFAPRLPTETHAVASEKKAATRRWPLKYNCFRRFD
jgi:hypothetical protein